VVLSSRREPPFPVARLRGQGQVLDVSASELAFTLAETAEVVQATIGDGAASDAGSTTGLAAELHEITAGWPAAVRLTSEALARDPPARRRATLDHLRRPGGVLHDYLAGEVIAAEPAEIGDLLARLAVLDRFTPELAEALGASGASSALPGLVRRGLVVGTPDPGQSWLSITALVREVLSAGSAPHRTATLTRASRWFEDHGQPADALRCALDAGAVDDIGRLIIRWGPQLLQAGQVDAARDAVQQVPPDDRTPEVHRLDGDARQLAGDWDGALACYERASGGADRLPPGLAWRMGLIHHLRGDLDAALRDYGRGAHADTDSDLADQALLRAWTATAHWLRGEGESCRALAEDAMDRARRSGDDRALAAAHTVRALVAALDGDRLANDTHYVQALDHAERAGDLLQIIRIRLNRGSRLNEEGFYDEAIAELELAIGLAELGGYAAFRAVALGNRGEARYRLGQFELAVDDLDSAKAIFQRLGSMMVAYPLAEAGEVHAARGQIALARAAFTEAVEVSRTSGDLQGLVPALAGLARLLADDDPGAARRLADEAVACGPVLGHVDALLAQGWAALAGGDPAEAADIARRAADLARVRRDRAGLAEGAELRAAAGPPDQAAGPLREALELWDELRNPLGQGRVLLALARLGGPDAADRARRAERHLRQLGARRLAVDARRLGSTARPVPALAIQCLGGFAVLRDGVPVPVGEWKSRKARDLVKILIARDGRPVHRGTLIDLLWPDDEPGRTSSRLSVTLSTARAVLDPAKTRPAGWYLVADADTIWLDVDHAEVDVLRFRDLAARAMAERKDGPTPTAIDALVAAEVAYVGDAFPEDPYEDWAVSPRERARAAYISVARTLADDTAAVGDTATAVRCYLRVLEHDAYDEHAHLGLVSAQLAAGQQGEARRSYQAYCVRMNEIGVEASPFPTVR
jgi:ATP/maltotriose-dependent transcriptional regulator MalT/DNA-binding SARP family transcriptional activator